MQLVYMDTNVVDVFLRRDNSRFQDFLKLKRTKKVDYLWNIELLSELAANPDVEGAKTSLRLAEELCGLNLFIREPKHRFQNEVMHVLLGTKRLSPFYSRAEVRGILKNRIWNPLLQGKSAEIFSWLAELKKRRYAEERQEYDKMKISLANLGLSAGATFDQVWTSASEAGWLISYMETMIQRQCGRKAGPGEAESISRRLPELPSVRCFTLHQAAYFHFVNVSQNRPAKHGNNVDARHIIAAANADIFITDDTGITDLLSASKQRWPFKTMTTGEFCTLFNLCGAASN